MKYDYDDTSQTREIDDALSRAVLARLGRTSGVVSVTQETWDFGFCETCSWPKEGFAVSVDGEQVWPEVAIMAGLGGCSYGDDEGRVRGSQLTSWGRLFSWLDGDPDWDKDDYEEDGWEIGYGDFVWPEALNGK